MGAGDHASRGCWCSSVRGLFTSESAGAVADTVALFDLDEQHPQARRAVLDGALQPGKRPHLFHGTSIELVPGEGHQFTVYGRSFRHYVRWLVGMRVRRNDGSQQDVVFGLYPGGRPFETSGGEESSFCQRRYWAWYLPEGGLWSQDEMLERMEQE